MRPSPSITSHPTPLQPTFMYDMFATIVVFMSSFYTHTPVIHKVDQAAFTTVTTTKAQSKR
ncbi:hypothetical protein IPO96_01325 [Candidatus Saccharibacteria bacterium]|nr:MAG: hypothetical protein IPO96_01325 [Candidatus Saccharibacteria bacterium]